MNLSSRSDGALFGAAIGDALGVTYEFRHPDDIPTGRFKMVGGGPFAFDPGEASDDTDLLHTSLLAYSARDKFDGATAVTNMVEWLDDLPLDVGGQTTRALIRWESGRRPEEDEDAQGNGGLMRAAAHALASDSPSTAARFAAEDTWLTHPSATARDCSAFYAATLWWILRGADVQQSKDRATEYAPSVPAYEILERSKSGWCVHSLRLALFALKNAPSFEAGMDTVIRTGGDTDTNGAIAGALLGAKFGMLSLPDDWLDGLEGKNRERLRLQAARLWQSSVPAVTSSA